MISLFLILAFAHSLFGAPVIKREILPSLRIVERRDSNAFLLDDNRTIWDIIWSCLATIFACTWVAVHPNIPSPKADWKSKIKNRLMVMAYAWIAPECVTMWAMRQWFSARRLVKMYNESRGIPEDNRSCFRIFWDSMFPCGYGGENLRLQRWTLTHGYFAEMGGYMIFREDQPYWTLFLEDIDLERDMNLVPYYTEEELMDRSKGDMFSKGVALLQTIWFGVQYFARVSNGLPLTELETITLAFATLNIATYILWWYKPLNVQCPIRVNEISPSRPISMQEEYHTRLHDLRPHSRGETISDQLSIPVMAFDDLEDVDDFDWDEPREIPWFLDGDEEVMKSSPSSGAHTLVITPPPPDCKELDKEDDDHEEVIEDEDPDATEDVEEWDLKELPWFPGIEVDVVSQTDQSSAPPSHLIRRTVTPVEYTPPRWHYRLAWNFPCFPRCIVITLDGGWYTVHVSPDDVEEDDLSSFVPRENTLSIDFYVPWYLRRQPWILQMCIVLPLWFPYIIFMVLYTFGPYRFFVFLLSPLASMAGTSQASLEPWLDNRYPLRVPTFYAGPSGALDVVARLRIWYTVFFLTSVFGAIHAFGWSSHFPSDAERTLWRVSTLVICCVPPTVALWIAYRRSSFPQFRVATTSRTPRISPFCIVPRAEIYQFLKFLAASPARIGMPMYILGRIALITLAFTSLRNLGDLPHDTFRSVPWTSTIPHF